MSFHLYIATVFVLGEKREMIVQCGKYSNLFFFPQAWLSLSFYLIQQQGTFSRNRLDWCGSHKNKINTGSTDDIF